MWLILLLCLIWGFNFTVMKLALDYFPPVLFSSIRFLIASILLLAICFYKKIPFPRKQDWKWYAICGILQTSFQFIANQQALQYIDSGLTSLLCYTMPIWFAILAHFFIGERLTKQKTVALVIGVIGLLIVMQINPFQIEWKGMTLLAQLLVLSGAIAWAVSNIIVKKVLEHHNKWQFTAYQMVIGTFVLFLYSIFFERVNTVIWGWGSNRNSFLFGSNGFSRCLYTLVLSIGLRRRWKSIDIFIIGPSYRYYFWIDFLRRKTSLYLDDGYTFHHSSPCFS